MLRDFSTQKQQELMSIVDHEANNDQWWNAPSWAIFKGSPQLRADCGNIDQYHAAVIDWDYNSRESLQKVFNRLYEVDVAYAWTFGKHTENLQSVRNEIESIFDISPQPNTLAAPMPEPPSLIERMSEPSSLIEREIDLRLQATVFELLGQERFSKSIWKTLSVEEKRVRLEEFYGEVQHILGTEVEGIDVVSIPSSSPGMITNGQYSPSRNRITLNSDNLAKADSYDMLRTIIHEMRHAYQWEVILDETSHIVSDRTREEWENNWSNYIGGDEDFILYISQPIEFDAESFAMQTDKTKIAEPSYRGSWIQ